MSEMPEVWQAEWCPHWHEGREVLTERAVDFVARQVPADAGDRDAMHEEVGTREIPVVRLPDGVVLDGDSDEIAALYPEPAGAAGHREHAAEG